MQDNDFIEDRWEDDGGYLKTRECQEEDASEEISEPCN